MRQAPKSHEELLGAADGRPQLVPDQDLTEADASGLAACHELAHDDAYEGHEPHG
jgi:hypothetical protein